MNKMQRKAMADQLVGRKMATKAARNQMIAGGCRKAAAGSAIRYARRRAGVVGRPGAQA